jgi:hypothetical protein
MRRRDFSKVLNDRIAKASTSRSREAAHFIDCAVLRIECLLLGSGVGVCELARLLGHEPEQALVLHASEHHSDGRTAVSACTTEFLEIVLYGRWMLQMDDQSNIGQIESHSKGIRADYDVGGRGTSAGETCE